MRSILASLATVTLLSATAPSAFGADGAVPIAVVPITINQAGSYILTRNVSSAGSGTAIYVTANDVYINLNGFQLQAGGGSGSANAIYTDTVKNFTVENGTVEGNIQLTRTTNFAVRHVSISGGNGS